MYQAFLFRFLEFASAALLCSLSSQLFAIAITGECIGGTTGQGEGAAASENLGPAPKIVALTDITFGLSREIILQSFRPP